MEHAEREHPRLRGRSDRNRGSATSPRFAGQLLISVLFALSASACDLSVTNPGPVADVFLDDEASHEGMVNGAGRALSDALNWITLTSGAIAQEIVGAGNLISHGVNLNQREGQLLPNDVSDHWDRAQRARWSAESGADRMREVLGSEFDSSPLAAEMLLYAGYSNRLLGENFCDAVFDGGPREPRVKYLERSLGQFEEAGRIAAAADRPDIALAAQAGRASVLAWLGRWDDAVTAAQGVPDDFVYEARYTTAHTDEFNRIYWAGGNSPFRTISVVTTFYNDYYLDTEDPRVPWGFLEGFPYGDSGDPPVPFHRQEKYESRSDGINLSSGVEMNLLIAEARLRAGDWQGAMAIINERRAALGVPAWNATNAEEAWTHLKRERGIELWLEGRRLGDLYRWVQEGVPGEPIDYEGQDLCFPIAQSELDTNPNL